MVFVRKRQIKGKTYFYLEHTTKVRGKSVKKERYLGKRVPKDIAKIKAEFLNEIYGERWFGKLGQIKKAFSREYATMPLAGKEKYLENFMIKFTYNTNKIEGGTLTLKETADLLEKGITPRKQIKDIKEAEAHKRVFYAMLGHRKDLNLRLVLYWHKLLFEGSQPEIAGKIRTHQVAIARSKFVPPMPVELDILLKEFFDWYNKARNKLNSVELAAFVHLKFVTVHPFTDGNGRISRLMMNFVLHKHGWPMLDISYANRSSYYTALERAQIKRIDHIFVQYFIKRYLKEYQKYLKNKAKT